MSDRRAPKMITGASAASAEAQQSSKTLGMIDAVLVNMPGVSISHPSIALGILKSILVHAGYRVRVFNFNLDFACRVGLDRYQLLFRNYSIFLGEWIFIRSAFNPPYQDETTYLRRAYETVGDCEISFDEFVEQCVSLRAQAESFIPEAAERILGTGAKVVGSTSSFQQQLASLAVLRQVKEADPNRITLLGGANCEGPMGAATSAIAPWVDIVVSGESEDIIVDLVTRSLCEVPNFQDLPNYVIAQQSQRQLVNVSHVAVGISEHFGTAPTPDYDDYFDELERSALSKSVSPILPVEASRGCWWGAKLQCTFCGLNGENMGYRAKSIDKIMDEWEQLTDKYGALPLGAVDNIFAWNWFDNLLPRLREGNRRYEVFFEIKANLKKSQIEQLAAAGITHIQPGIESLSTPILKLMAKGCAAYQNLQLLRWATAAGIRLQWGFLYGFPTESTAEYLRMAEFVPLLTHLQPPDGFFPIEFHRYSVYHRNPESHGLQLRPAWPYIYLYPNHERYLPHLAYIFESVSPLESPPQEEYGELADQISKWIDSHAKGLTVPTFTFRKCNDEVEVIDNRVRPRFSKYVAKGIRAQLLLFLDSAPTISQALSYGTESLGWTKYSMNEHIVELLELGLILEMDGRYILLPTEGKKPFLSQRTSLWTCPWN